MRWFKQHCVCCEQHRQLEERRTRELATTQQLYFSYYKENIAKQKFINRLLAKIKRLEERDENHV